MTPLSLVAVFADVPDPRSRHGRRCPLVPILPLVTLGLLLGCKSLAAIGEIPARYGANPLLALGFPGRRCPSACAIREPLAALDAQAVGASLTRWIDSRRPDRPALPSLDGKALRGSRDGALPGQHLVAAYAPTSQRSWPDGASMPRPTSTRPPCDC